MVESDQRKKKTEADSKTHSEFLKDFPFPFPSSFSSRLVTHHFSPPFVSSLLSRTGQSPPGGTGPVGGVRRQDVVSEQQLRRREFPSAAEAAGLLPPAAQPQWEEQRSCPGEGESKKFNSHYPSATYFKRNFYLYLFIYIYNIIFKIYNIPQLFNKLKI